MNSKKFKNRAGFTLIELIVVIAIMAILAGVAVPVYSGYIEKAEKAGDLQLLGAVNSAFAAACVENGVDVYTVESEVAKPKITSYKATIDVAPFSEEFQKYFAGNESAEFKVITQLLFVNGAFVDPATAANTPGSGIAAVTYGGATIYMSEEDIKNLTESTFLSASTLNGSAGLLDQVDFVTNMAAGMADGALNTVLNDPAFTASAMAALGVTTADEYAQKQEEIIQTMMANDATLTRDQAVAQLGANAAVLYAAQNAVKFTNNDINKLFSDTGIDEIKNNLKTTGQTTTGMAQAALVYGMYTAYAHSTEYGNATLQANTQDAAAVLNALQNDANFKAYVNSAAGQKDIDAYMGALNMITDSAESDPDAVAHLMANGFNNAELKDIVANLTGE